MLPAPLDELLTRLSAGDMAAAEQTFRTYEPFLRKAVRRQLPPRFRARFDSCDVVQSVWADLLANFRQAGWSFADVNHLRAFLCKATRNRFIDRIRQHKPSLMREEPLPLEETPEGGPSPSEMAQAEDVWARLLLLCPPEHHEILRLKRQGCSLAEIAAQTGLHSDSVRRILRALARRLAFPSTHLPSSPQS